MSTQSQALVTTSPLITELANEWKITPVSMLNTLKSQVFPQEYKGNKVEVTPEMLIAFLQVCNTYKLNPFVKEIYAFPAKNGSIVPMVPIDGWANIINRNPNFDGLEFVDEWVEGDKPGTKSLFSTTCIIYRKDRTRPIKVTEYMQECYQPTKDPWVKWPARMLRHKSLIQCARIAFSLAGIYDPDEAERIAEGEEKKAEIKRPTVIDAKPSAPATVLGHDAGAAPASAVESSTVKDQPGQAAPAKNSAPVEQETGEADAVLPADNASPATQKCFCTCCKNAKCDCLGKDDVDRCGCPNCVKYMSLMQGNQERATEEPSATPSLSEVFGGAKAEEPSTKPGGPYVPQDKLKRLFAAAAGAGVQVVKDSHEDALHQFLKTKYKIESLKEIPVSMYDQIVSEIAPNLKVKSTKK